MEILLAGLALFIGVHLIPVAPPLRTSLHAKFGENGYKIAFSVVSALGLALIVIGYARAPAEPRLFQPFQIAIQLAPWVVTVSFVLLVASNLKTHIRRTLRHPMLIAVGLWAGVHLLATGQARAALLFGAFLAYVVVDLASVWARGAVKRFTPDARYDVAAVVAGVVAALAVMTLHRPLFGALAAPWGL